MNKNEFLAELKKGLYGLPENDIEERLNFYSEMIDDLIEEGKTESEAIESIDCVEDIVKQTVSDIPLAKLVKQKIKTKRSMRAWEIVLIGLGFPLWFPLLIAFFAVAVSLYAVLWALIVSLWAIEGSFFATALGGIFLGLTYFIQNDFLSALAMLGIGLVSAGIAYFAFFGCVAASKGVIILTKKALLGIKSSFVGKEKTK